MSCFRSRPKPIRNDRYPRNPIIKQVPHSRGNPSTAGMGFRRDIGVATEGHTQHGRKRSLKWRQCTLLHRPLMPPVFLQRLSLIIFTRKPDQKFQACFHYSYLHSKGASISPCLFIRPKRHSSNHQPYTSRNLLVKGEKPTSTKSTKHTKCYVTQDYLHSLTLPPSQIRLEYWNPKKSTTRGMILHLSCFYF